MTVHKRRTLFLSLLVFFTVLISTLSAAGTFFPGGESLYSHWSYLACWGALVVLCFLYPFVVPMRKGRLGDFVGQHAGFILLFFAVVISFLTTGRGEMTLYGGETLLLKETLSEMGIPWKGDSVELHYLSSNIHGSDIRTKVSITENGNKRLDEISVNDPLRFRWIKFYQQGGGLGVREILFTLNGNEYNLFDQDEGPLALGKGYFLTLLPQKYIEESVVYRWEIADGDGRILDSGEFFSSESPLETPYFEIEITRERVAAVSVLAVVYFPMAVPLSVVALLFLVKLAFSLWGKKNDD